MHPSPAPVDTVRSASRGRFCIPAVGGQRPYPAISRGGGRPSVKSWLRLGRRRSCSTVGARRGPSADDVHGASAACRTFERRRQQPGVIGWADSNGRPRIFPSASHASAAVVDLERGDTAGGNGDRTRAARRLAGRIRRWICRGPLEVVSDHTTICGHKADIGVSGQCARSRGRVDQGKVLRLGPCVPEGGADTELQLGGPAG